MTEMTIELAIWRPRVIAPTVELPPYPRDRITIAYHEAAHAVLCLRFGIRIRGAVVYSDGGGKVDLERSQPAGRDIPASIDESDYLAAPLHADPSLPNDALQLAAIRIAVMYVGGTVAEILLNGLCVDGPLAMETQDWRNARSVLKDVFGHDRMMHECEMVAYLILAEHWGWVEAVAVELDLHSEISVREIERLRSRWPARPIETAAKQAGSVRD